MEAYAGRPSTTCPSRRSGVPPAPLATPVGGETVLSRDLAGGKAVSLDMLTRAGFAVPAAVVLTTRFFAPWITELERMPAWRALAAARQEDWPRLLPQLKAELATIAWTPEQSAIIDSLEGDATPDAGPARFAVRSSSPEEDQDNASFAGLYRSCIGVRAQEIGDAIRACFAACVDLPVLAYKAARGMRVFEPACAVIVQRQLHSEVSGVGFSINALNNDHDEMLVSASWGLGEAIVDGNVVPDQFVLEKVSGRVLDSVEGSKACASVLAADGGTRLMRTARQGLCLTPAQLDELAAALARIELLFGRPVDVEFAFAAGTLYILQARAVSTWVPLAPPMMSAPSAQRTLYMDMCLAKGLTINAPVSPMGQDWLGQTIASMARHCAGQATLALDSPGGWVCIQGGRMYLNLSRALCFTTPQKLARANAPTDALLARTLDTIDATRYRSPRPASLLPLLALLPRVLWRLRRSLWRTLQAWARPVHAHRLYRAREQQVLAALSAPLDPRMRLQEAQERLGAAVAEAAFDVAMPAMLAGLGAAAAISLLTRKDSEEEQRLVAHLACGIGGNVVVDMGIAMYRLARMLPPHDFADLDLLARRIAAGDVAPDFLGAWERFMASYGWRGPGEMDLANPSYRDAPAMLLRQMSTMAAAPAENDPEHAHRQLAKQREAACHQLQARFGPVRRLLLRRLYLISSLFAGTRDTPKHFNLLARQRIRERAQAAGAELAAAGHLDRAEDVFGLAYADLAGPAGASTGICLRTQVRTRGSFLALLARQVRSFPALIDSRGRILRAPPADHDVGCLRGIGLSPGVVRGRVKCLRDAHEKPVAPGDVLVAFTTDPGWTPLFIGTAAIVLEVGGVLQHGALVARELGKPCVAGIADVLARLRDGMLVEVDGAGGTVVIVEAA